VNKPQCMHNTRYSWQREPSTVARSARDANLFRPVRWSTATSAAVVRTPNRDPQALPSSRGAQPSMWP
jgi:hypothetical protein